MKIFKKRNRIYILVIAVLSFILTVTPSVVSADDPIVTPDGWEWHNPSPQGKDLRAVWGRSATDVYAVGGLGTILHYDDNSWTSMYSGTTNYLRGIWGSSSSDVYAVGHEGTILHYDGNSWNLMDSGTDKPLYDVWGTSPSNVYAAGDFDTILHYDGK